MKIFVLIQAGEGITESIFVCGGFTKGNFIDFVWERYSRYIDEMPLPWTEGNQGFMEKERDALIEMLKQHPNWDVGQYTLKNIEPQGQEWKLIVADGHFSIIW